MPKQPDTLEADTEYQRWIKVIGDGRAEVVRALEKRYTSTLKSHKQFKAGLLRKENGREAVSFRLFGEPLARQIQYIKNRWRR